MNKVFVLFLFFACFSLAFACKCSDLNMVGVNFQKADFVGEVEILKIHNSAKKSRTYRADIKVLKIYKGNDITTLEVRGLKGDIRSAACEEQINKGEKYLIYLSKNNDDIVISMTTSNYRTGSREYFAVSACTPKLEIKENSSRLASVRAALEFLSANPSTLAQAMCIDNSVSAGSESVFKNYTISEPARSFAVYKLKVNSKSEVEEIEALQNFGSAQDEDIMRLIKQNFVISKDFFNEVRDEEVLLTLFYNPDKSNVWKDALTLSLEEPAME